MKIISRPTPTLNWKDGPQGSDRENLRGAQPRVGGRQRAPGEVEPARLGRLRMHVHTFASSRGPLKIGSQLEASGLFPFKSVHWQEPDLM